MLLAPQRERDGRQEVRNEERERRGCTEDLKHWRKKEKRREIMELWEG